MGTKAIRSDADAVAWIKANAEWAVTKIEGGVVVEEESCYRCGGKGHLGRGINNVPWGVCYRCNGHDSKRIVRTPVRRWAQKAKANAAARQRNADAAAAKQKASVERVLDGQRNWCEDNGYGRITFAERDAARQAKWDEKAAAVEYVGEVGKRQVFEATIKVVVTWDGFGRNDTVYLHIMEDADGNTITWKTTNNGFTADDGCWASKGDRVKFKATVKEHGTYKGTKQTVVTRATVIKVADAQQQEAA